MLHADAETYEKRQSQSACSSPHDVSWRLCLSYVLPTVAGCGFPAIQMLHSICSSEENYARPGVASAYSFQACNYSARAASSLQVTFCTSSHRCADGLGGGANESTLMSPVFSQAKPRPAC
ncbi:hypothetical protein CIRG_02525 [Coccidioides immitis RMSCC 2394]|uniref:Uncharacterized protein n=1 Tax=Coccidioides immitis RMSCC 2394 TaxID=404692 RepID=A0A0J6Y826_COCIT|nr:hypothetical protein CIRG_02525 [Coccidioides immitis RMSCC 2394]